MPVNYTKALSPEQYAVLNAVAEKYTQSNEPVVIEPLPDPVIPTHQRATLEDGTPVNPATPKVIPTPVLSAPRPTSLSGVEAQAKKSVMNMDTYSPISGIQQQRAGLEAALQSDQEVRELERAKVARNNLWQTMLDGYKKKLEGERTDAARLATFNALGNALRTMAQPIGWMGGGATAGVQPYDNRQYLEAFNRAIKTGEDIRNLDKLDMQYKLDFANKEIERKEAAMAAAAKNDQRIRELMLKYELKAGSTRDPLTMEKARRFTQALHDYRAAKYNWHEGAPDVEEFKDYLRNNGGLASYGLDENWTPTPEMVNEIVGGTDNGAETATAKPQVTTTASLSGLTPDERALIATWKKYDSNGDGVIDKDESKVARSNGTKIPKSVRTAYEAVSKKKNGGKSQSTSSKATTAKAIMR